MEFRRHNQLHLSQAYSTAEDRRNMMKYINYAKKGFLVCYENHNPILKTLEKMSK